MQIPGIFENILYLFLRLCVIENLKTDTFIGVYRRQTQILG